MSSRTDRVRENLVSAYGSIGGIIYRGCIRYAAAKDYDEIRVMEPAINSERECAGIRAIGQTRAVIE